MTARLKGVACAALLALAGCRRPPAAPASAAGPAGRNAGGWEEVPIGTDAVFNALHFVDAETGWIVGGSPFVSGGVAGRTEDGGKTWRYVTGVTGGGPTSGLSAVHGFHRMRACAVGEDRSQLAKRGPLGAEGLAAAAGGDVAGHARE